MSAPTPVPLAVVPALVAVAVPLGLEEVPLAELVEPVGGAGGTGPGEPPPVPEPEAVSVTVGEVVVMAVPLMWPVMVAMPVVVAEVNVAL